MVVTHKETLVSRINETGVGSNRRGDKTMLSIIVNSLRSILDSVIERTPFDPCFVFSVIDIGIEVDTRQEEFCSCFTHTVFGNTMIRQENGQLFEFIHQPAIELMTRNEVRELIGILR